ncbi:MAG: hypothetical protein ACOC7R_01655 [Planctomycetota bacterium]
MKDKNSITIAALTASAALLLTAILLTGGSDEATAAQAESQGRAYTMVAAQATSDRDILYVLDRTSEQLMAYAAAKDTRSNDILIVEGPIDLARLITRTRQNRRTPEQ